jgi:TP901 family phage tail tape measure protein
VAEAARLQVVVGADTRQLTSGLSRASGRLSSFGNIAKKVGIAASAGLIGFGAASAKAAVDFESSFAGVRKTVNATEPELRQLAKGFRGMAKQLPATVHQINEVGEAAGQLGIKKKNILTFTRTMIDLGESTNLSATDAAQSLARLANITQMPQTQFRRLGSVVVALGNNLATTEREIVDMGLRIAGAGKQVGMTEAQILSFAGALSSVGVEAQAGGSAISRVMLDMQASVDKGGAKLGEFARVAGMSAGEFKTAFKTDAAGAIVAFVEGLGRIKREGGSVNGELEKLGLNEQRVRDTLLRATGAGDLFRKSLKLGSEAWRENTALSREAEQRYKTTASQLKMLRNRFYDLRIVVGSALLPVLNKAMAGVGELFERIGKAKGTTAKIKVGIELAGDALASLRTMLLGSSKRVKLPFGDFVDVDTPGLAQKLVAAFQTIPQKLVAAFQTIPWAQVGSAMASGLSAALAATGSLAQAINSGVTAAIMGLDFAALGKKIGPGIALGFATAITSVLDPAFWIANWETAAGLAFAALSLVFLPARFVKAIPLLGGFLAAIRGATSGIVGAAARLGGEFLSGLARGIAPGVTATVGRIIASFRTGLGELGPTIRRAVGDAAHWFGVGMGMLVREGVSILARLPGLAWAAIRALAPRLAAGVELGLQAVRSKAGAFLAAARTLGQRIVTGVVSGAQALAALVRAKVSDGVQAVRAAAGAAFSAAVAVGKAIVDGVLSGVGGLMGALKGRVEGMVRGALSHLNPFSPVEHGGEKYIGRPIAEGAIKGWILGSAALPSKIADGVRQAVEAGRKAVEAARGRFQSAWSQLAQDATTAFDGIASKVKTPSEMLLEKLDKDESEREWQKRMQEAKQKLSDAWNGTGDFAADADAAGDPEKAAELARKREQGIAEAQESIRQLELEKYKAWLEERAARERLDQDARDALKRRHFEQELTNLAAHLERTGATYRQSQQAIVKLLNKYGVSYRDAGFALGMAFAKGLNESMGEVEQRAKEIAEAASKYLKLHSPAEKGPLSTLNTWWSALPDTLLGGVDLAGMNRALGASIAQPELAPSSGAGGGGAQELTLRIVADNDSQVARMLARMVEPELNRGSARIALQGA